MFFQMQSGDLNHVKLHGQFKIGVIIVSFVI